MHGKKTLHHPSGYGVPPYKEEDPCHKEEDPSRKEDRLPATRKSLPPTRNSKSLLQGSDSPPQGTRMSLPHGTSLPPRAESTHLIAGLCYPGTCLPTFVGGRPSSPSPSRRPCRLGSWRFLGRCEACLQRSSQQRRRLSP